jgi:hypothetical protein
MQRNSILALAIAVIAGGSAFDASAQAVTARLKADDHHMLFLSTDPAAPGVIMAQGAGWSYEHDARFYLYGSYTDYYIHIWVQDVGASLAGVMGDFKITADPQFPGRVCKFDNGLSLLTTNTTFWQATDGQAQTTNWTPIPGDFGGVVNNDMPTSFLTPVLVPSDLGNNTSGGSPWPYYANSINPAARYLNNPGNTTGIGQETWYTTHITCKPKRK